MKNVILTIALVIVMAFFMFFQGDINQMVRQGNLVKDASEQMASTAALDINEERYGEGYICFDHSAGATHAYENVRINLNLNSDYTSNNAYYADTAQIYLYFFDDSLKYYKYHNGAIINDPDNGFNYGDLASSVTDIKTITGQDFTITKPCIVTIIDAGIPRMRVDELAGLGKIRKMSIYEYTIG